MKHKEYVPVSFAIEKHIYKKLNRVKNKSKLLNELLEKHYKITKPDVNL
jgi:hypothetical protein